MFSKIQQHLFSSDFLFSFQVKETASSIVSTKCEMTLNYYDFDLRLLSGDAITKGSTLKGRSECKDCCGRVPLASLIGAFLMVTAFTFVLIGLESGLNHLDNAFKIVSTLKVVLGRRSNKTIRQSGWIDPRIDLHTKNIQILNCHVWSCMDSMVSLCTKCFP